MTFFDIFGMMFPDDDEFGNNQSRKRRAAKDDDAITIDDVIADGDEQSSAQQAQSSSSRRAHEQHSPHFDASTLFNKRPKITARTKQGSMSKGQKIGIGILIAIIALIALIFGLSTFITEVLWFNQLGYSSVIWTQLAVRVGLWIFYALIVALTASIAARLAIRARPGFSDGSQVRVKGGILQIDAGISSKTARRLATGIAFIVGAVVGAQFNANWSEVLLMFHAQQFGSKDPQFGLDTGFYVFVLPGLMMIVTMVCTMLTMGLIFSVATHALMGGIRLAMPVHGKSLFDMTARARRQIALWFIVTMLAWAVRLGLSVFSSLTAQDDRITGAQYTAVHATIPTTLVMAILLALMGIVIGVWMMTTRSLSNATPATSAAAALRQWRTPVVAVAVVVIAGLLLSIVYPALLQRFRVNPNAQELESTYIQRNIDATTAAYGLNKVKVEEYDATTQGKSGALSQETETTAQIRLLDPQVVSPTFKQLQQSKQYYTFADTLAVDKYNIDGVSQDTVIGVRELNLDGNDNRNWVNDHTVYTHGYGVVAAYGNKVTADGQPMFFEQGIPTQGALTQAQQYEPRIYFSPNAPEYSIVGAGEGQSAWEFDYPTGSKGATNTFDGNGGPSVGNLFNRLLYAIRFGSDQILFSDRVTNNSQILYDRNPRTRVQKVAPYLTLDGRVYPAVVDGRVKWIVDGFTTSDAYPYSQKTDLGQATTDSLTVSSKTVQGLGSQEANYIRNSVKAVVDAYDGSVDLYAWDVKDPVLQAWQKIFPGQYKPISQMSGDLISHMRYPESLFKVQRELLSKYHVTSASQYFSGEDFWQTPTDPTESKQEQEQGILQPPYYLTMQTPGTDKPIFSLTSTYIPAGSVTREILTGFLSVDSDAGNTAGTIGPDYGTIRLLELPKNTNVPGPGQAQNNFNANADVSKELNLLESGSTNVVRGNLLTLPLGGGLVYVQPVYVQSSGSTSYPLLKKVLVAFGDQVGFADTLDESLNQVFGGNSGAKAGDADNSTPGTTSTEATDEGADQGQKPDTSENTSQSQESGSSSVSGALQQALQDAAQAMKDADQARRDGDWASYGKAQEQLQESLDKAVQLSK